MTRLPLQNRKHTIMIPASHGADNPRRLGRREGRRRRDDAHHALLARRGRYVRLAQAALLDAIAEHGHATADDIRQRLTLPPDINPTLIGPAVRQLRLAGVIRRVGRDVETCRPVAHARPLPLWETTSPDAARHWRADHPAPLPLPTPVDAVETCEAAAVAYVPTSGATHQRFLFGGEGV